MRRLLAITVLFLTALPCHAEILYVDADAPGLGDGSSWTDAYPNLQQALANADGTHNRVEIRVAQGVYKPDQGAAEPAGSVHARFQLKDNVSILGGYAGLSGPDPDARDVGLYATVLSGDLTGDDQPDFVNYDNNSQTVVTSTGNDRSAVLDGFTVTAGNGWSGPGISCYDSLATIRNCTFSKNRAIGREGGWGGAVYNGGGAPLFEGCTFEGNWAMAAGGAVYSQSDANAVLRNCTFLRNYAKGSGGAVAAYQCDVVLEGCRFETNETLGDGGGVQVMSARPTLTDCTFYNNRSVENGGGLYCGADAIVTKCTFQENRAREGGGAYCGPSWCCVTDPVFTDCTFHDNAAGEGGGLWIGDSNPTLTGCRITSNMASARGGGILFGSDNASKLTHCLIAANQAGEQGGGAYLQHTFDLALGFCTIAANHVDGQGGGLIQGVDATFGLSHCILWNNTDATDSSHIVVEAGPQPQVRSSCLNADPLFADPNNGDYHLKSQGGRWDPMAEVWIVDDVTSPCIDAGDPMSPIGHEPFPNGGIVNMGAYGGTAEASKSYFGGPPCETIVAGDVNGDCRVDFLDLALMGLHWSTDNNP